MFLSLLLWGDCLFSLIDFFELHSLTLWKPCYKHLPWSRPWFTVTAPSSTLYNLTTDREWCTESNVLTSRLLIWEGLAETWKQDWQNTNERPRTVISGITFLNTITYSAHKLPTTTMVTFHLTLKTTAAQVVEMSVTNNSFSKDYPHLDDHAKQITDTPGFKPLLLYHCSLYPTLNFLVIIFLVSI